MPQRLLVRDVPSAAWRECVSAVRRRLAGRRYANVDLVLVTSDDGTLLGVVEMADLLAAGDGSEIAGLARRDWPQAGPDVTQEMAAGLARNARVGTIVVVDTAGRPLGVIPAARLLEVQHREHHEDVHRLVGMLKSHNGEVALAARPLHRVALRLPWLVAGLLLSTTGTALMASFEEALKANVAIAFFIPAIVYLTDAIGTQTEAMAVRGLSTRDWPLRRTLALEAATGGLIGVSLAAIAFCGVGLAFGDLRIAVGVAITITVAGALASVLGLMLPWALSRLDLDPAFGSGPIATIVQDVLTLLVYFLVMAQLLPPPGA